MRTIHVKMADFGRHFGFIYIKSDALREFSDPKNLIMAASKHLFDCLSTIELKMYVLCRKQQVITFRGHVQAVPGVVFQKFFLILYLYCIHHICCETEKSMINTHPYLDCP